VARGSTHRPLRVGAGLAAAFAGALVLTIAIGLLLERVWDSSGATGFDSTVTHWFVDHRTDTWSAVMRAVTWLGSSAVVIPLATVVVAALLVDRRRWLALFLALAVGGASVLSVLTKQAVGRERPPIDLRLQHPVGSAFPSGHTTQATATYFALAIVVTVLSRSRSLRAATWSVATLIAFLVGMSRVYLGVHWATDVMGGWFLGGLWLAGLTFALWPLDGEIGERTVARLLPGWGTQFRCAARGVGLAVRQRNLRIMLGAACAVIAAAAICDVSDVRWAVLLLCIASVLGAEIFNSAIEKLADRVEPGYDNEIRDTKDMAAAGVLTISCITAVIGVIVFWPYVIG
jgi:undecaprenyl-diphosphatase